VPDGATPAAQPAPDATARDDAPPSAWRRARWTLLAFVPSAQLMGVTRYLTTDVAPVPLLWVVPLALYLVTFIVAFSPRLRVRPSAVDRAASSVLPVLAVMVVLDVNKPLALVLYAHLTALLAVAVWCHQTLADDRPGVGRLTDFYLWMSVGGLLGGVFNALLAPALFTGLAEYPLVIAAAAATRLVLRTPPAPPTPRTRLGARLQRIAGLAPSDPRRSVALLRRLAAPLAIGTATYFSASGLSLIPSVREAGFAGILGGVAALATIALRADRVAFALAVAAVLAGGALGQRARQASVLLRARSFYGAYTVRESSPLHYLQHGTTLHGTQDRSPSRRTTPLSYYHREGPLGVLLTVVPRLAPTAPARRVAAVGLGTGTVACHGRAGERWTFYEIDPLMERIARDPRLFTYLRDCPPASDVVLGDARLRLAEAAPGTYDLIVLDAFSSDAIPTHLLTREALATYVRALTPGGVVAVHISNRYLDLEPVVAALARDAGLVALLGRDTSDAWRREIAVTTSRWIALARDSASLGELATFTGWDPPAARKGVPVWTDDYTDVLSVVNWK
ncbi:fused MFS/spermidine synthase, partial [Roseisolibacter sp. H3M3-2]|uniref:fused MFS/spermidine synthase n=1 Tax=Roseisolibacter sp. H3M3-2 TaxID=3031323 RepID=UPI0023DA3C9F